MIDRKKVIKALEVCSSIPDGKECPKECPYKGQDMYCVGSSGLMLDAVDLLKEYENLEKRHEILVNHADTMLAMLKERNEKIAVLNRFIEQMPKPTKLLDVFCDEYAKVVRCKDCKHYMTIHCTCDGCCISDDWFCADGERRDDDG